MQSLNYLNYNELKCFAKVQGFCLLIASMLLIVSHFFIYSQVSFGVQALFVFLFSIFLIVYIASTFFGERLKPYFTKLTIVTYSVLSMAMLLVFFM
jgi:hypothetical protein